MSGSKKSKSEQTGPRKPRFPELPPKYSSSRELRNKAEKMRRDRLNKLIEEIRALVPIICNKTKKSETTRSNILRLTANFLRVQRLFPLDEPKKEDEDCGTSSSMGALVPVSNGEKTDPPFLWDGLPHLESMEGFFFLIAEDGRVLFISENVDKFIGYSQIDMMGHPIFNFCHPADLAKLKATLNTGDRRVTGEDDEEEEEERQSFYVRLKEKPLAKNDSVQYEHLHVVGRRRRVARTNKGGLLCNFTFVGVMRPVRDRPITELSLVESVQDQYITRHLPDGRIIYADHRIATIAGYLPGEVKGKSAFNFFNAEDLPWTTMAMRHMFASSKGEGSTVYRLLTQTGQYICLQTKGYLEFNRTTNKIETFICINTVVKPEDEEKYLNEQKERFSPFITELEVNSMKQPKLTYSPSPSLSNGSLCSPTRATIASSPTRAMFASPPMRTPATTPVSVFTTSSSPRSTYFPPTIICSPTISPTAQSSSYLRPPSPYQQAKRSLSPQPQGNIKRSALSPPQLTSVIKAGGGGSKRHHNGILVNGVQYVKRVDPHHRVENGHRVVDIDQDVFPALSQAPSGGSGRETATSHLDFTGVIEEHNEMHHMQRLMELPTLDGLQLEFDLGVGNNVQQQQQQQQQQPPPVPQQRVNSVIKALPQQQHQHPAPPQQYPEDRTKGDLIAEKLKLLASDKSEEGSTFKSKKDEEQEQDLLSLLREQPITFPQQTVDNIGNYMSWEVKEEEVFPS